MENTALDTSGTDLDSKLLSSLIHELNISRRHVTAYPENHPIIAASTQKAVQLLQQLLQIHDHITIGIARDVLLIGNSFLDKENLVYRDFARFLFGHGIAAITVQKQLTQDELRRFNTILSQKRENLRDRGIQQILTDAGIRHLQVQRIDYDAFQTIEDGENAKSADDTVALPSTSLWEDFIHGLLDGTLNPDGEQNNNESIDPTQLAALLNHELLAKGEVCEMVFDSSIIPFMRRLEGNTCTVKQRLEAMDNVGTLLRNLAPPLRKLFLTSTFKSLAGRKKLAEEVLGRFPDEVILEALEEATSQQNTYTPPLIVKVLERLSHNMNMTGGPAFTREGSAVKDQEEKLRQIFREDCLDEFVPKAYQTTLRTIISSETISAVDQKEIYELKESLSSHRLEAQISAVILEIINALPAECQAELLQKNLLDLSNYFLEMGDYASLVTIHDRISGSSQNMAPHLRDEVLGVFATSRFVGEVLNGLTIWGKAKYPEIRTLIQRVGAPFVEPLLLRLAEESNMSLRRYYMDRLLDLKVATRKAALAYLRDNRWYFVRNIVVILRSLGDQSVVRPIRRLIEHPHVKVRHEVLKTLLHFRAPDTDRLLLKEMASDDHQTRLSAIQLTEKSRSPEVFRGLIDLLVGRGISGPDLEIKRAVIATLAEIGNVDALPHLEGIVRSWHLFRKAAHNSLKAEVIRSLERYPAQSVGRFLKDTAQSGKGELAELAAETLKNLNGSGI